MSYKVFRFYFDDSVSKRIIKTGLTLEQAQAHCQDPETSSSTCTRPENVAHTEEFGPWFDGYDEERR